MTEGGVTVIGDVAILWLNSQLHSGPAQSGECWLTNSDECAIERE